MHPMPTGPGSSTRSSDLGTWILLEICHSYICVQPCLLLSWPTVCSSCMDFRPTLWFCPLGRPQIHVVWPCLQLLLAGPQSWHTASPCPRLPNSSALPEGGGMVPIGKDVACAGVTRSSVLSHLVEQPWKILIFINFPALLTLQEVKGLWSQKT